MRLLNKHLFSVIAQIVLLGIGSASAQIHEISFVGTDHYIDFHHEYSLSNWEYDFWEYGSNPQFIATLGAIGETYINFVSSDTARYMKEIRPLIMKDSTGDFYSSLPGVIKEHRYLGKKKHSYEHFTISIDAFVSYCREKGINCDLASRNFGTEMKLYKFQQKATELVYNNLYEDFASWCTSTDSTGEHLYDYALNIGDAYPYGKEGYSVLPVSVVLKQNKNTRQFFNMFVNIMDALRIPDSVAQVMKGKNYKTYHIKVYTLPSYEWQMDYRKAMSKTNDIYISPRTPYFYLKDISKEVDGQFYLPLNSIALNSIFERIHYQFQIYDNISGKNGFSYAITDAMSLIPKEVYNVLHLQYEDETKCYMSDLGYTSQVYDMGTGNENNNGNIVILALTDTGNNVTESLNFDIIMNNDDLMKLTSLDITNAPDMVESYYIPYWNDVDKWSCRDSRGDVMPWNKWNTLYMLGFTYNKDRRPITYFSKQDYSKISGIYEYDNMDAGHETIYIQDGQWLAEGGYEYYGYNYKGTISKDGRLIISEGVKIKYDGIGGKTTTKVNAGEEHGRFKYHTIVTKDALLLKKEK